MKPLSTLTLASIALLSLAVALPTGAALAQQKQKVTYKAAAANTKYTQQHTIDVGDTPGIKCAFSKFTAPFRPTRP